MTKRKQGEEDNSDDSGSDVSLVDVDFDFFSPNPDVDYHALKRLLEQLFQRDSPSFLPQELTELILSQSSIGTTIKTDGKESDPFALLTVLNMHVHREHPSIKALAEYFLQKSSTNQAFHSTLQSLFSQTQNHVGLIVCERLINMPVQVIPPMYNMLLNEIQGSDNFSFSHLIFVSRTYHLSQAEEEYLSNSNTKQRTKKKTKGATQSQPGRPQDGIYPFHPEDDVIKQYESHSADYTFSNAPTEPRDNESFGLDNRGRIILVPISSFPSLVSKMAEVYSAA